LIIIVYIIIAGLLIVAFRKITNIRIKQQKLIYLKKLKQQNEAQIIKMNNQLLQSKVADKSKELASYTMLLKRKNEVLTELKLEIEQLELSKTKSNLLTKAKAIKIINSNLSDKNDLEAFNLHFNEGYDNFIIKLKQRHPEITPNDMRLCAFLRMNLATKEIAVLLNLSPRSVEVKRYRLRKKLGLATEDNLTNYLMEL
jgi:DNA-binding CsgD family transcriptional regulator